ncbi:hypothetical protein GSH19_06690 [Lactobacillus sp. S2-2]|uniref:hypothetical protein n=1 Tax=Lactobacillus sp. S2-2 TaxID=2692917 RepID=UPI001F2E4C71|nr:hypothetical protein [Lactobacillus sp. S2-2]MCF6515831.1 hypothetical protein [Lactobacillus sp. S2-2]
MNKRKGFTIMDSIVGITIISIAIISFLSFDNISQKKLKDSRRNLEIRRIEYEKSFDE